MSGKKGQKWARAMTQQQRDAISLTKIEKYLDAQIDGQFFCESCKGEHSIPEIPNSAVQMLRMRYDKLRPTLASTTSEIHVTHFGDALARMAKRYEVENAAVLTTETTQPVPSPSEDGHAIH